MNDYERLHSIDQGVDITNDILCDIRNLLTEIRDLLKPAPTISTPAGGVSAEGAAWAMEATT